MTPASSISRKRLPALVLFLAMIAGLSGPCARAIIINGEGPANLTGIYDRFVVGSYPNAPVANPGFIGAAFDLSGIGWLASGSTQSVTLVGSRYIIGASHAFPSSGTAGTLKFLGTDNLLHTATVASSQTLTYTGTNGAQASDLTIGRLTTALPSSVTPMPIFYAGATSISNPSSFDAYDGVSLYNYGHTARMGTNDLDGFSQYSLFTTADNIGLVYTQGAGAGETLLEGGDSGSPTIAYRDGVYGLIGVHSGVDAPNKLSVDAFVSYTSYVNQMNAFMAADGQSLILVVPEPGTILVGLALLGICGASRVRRARPAH